MPPIIHDNTDRPGDRVIISSSEPERYAAAYPGATNVHVQQHYGLIVDYARNMKAFPVNRYTQVVPVDKMTDLYLNMTIEEAGRIQSTDLAEALWEDGQDAPDHLDGKEKHEWLSYETKRYSWGVRLGDLTVDQADWDILKQYTSIKGRQAMTGRTQLAITQFTNTALYDASHVINVTTITGNLGSTSGNWREGTTANQNIKRSLIFAQEKILDDTLSAVGDDDLMLVINSEMAGIMALTQEIVDYIKGSPVAYAQVKGELQSSNRNRRYDLPEKLYGVELIVEDTRKVTSKKGATRAVSQVLTTSTPFMCARPGGLEGVAGPNFSTVVCHAKEEMAVETIRNAEHRYTKVRVIDNVAYTMVAPASGVLFTNAA